MKTATRYAVSILVWLYVAAHLQANSKPNVIDYGFLRDVRVSGWVFQSYVTTSANRLPEQNFAGREAGLRTDVHLLDALDFRSLIKYENASEDGQPVEFVFGLFDWQLSKNGITTGSRVGRLEIPFGLQADTKNGNPRFKLSPLSTSGFPPNLIWGYQQKLFSSLDGWSFYGSLQSFPASISIELLRGQRGNLKPNVNYVQELDGITANKQIVHHAMQFDLQYMSSRLRVVELIMETRFDISEKHWSEYLSNRVGFAIPERLWITGNYGINYVYHYAGFEQYVEQFSITYENILFYYKKGTAERYFDAVGAAMPERTKNYQNVLLKYHYDRKLMLYVGKGLDKSSDDAEEDWRYYLGVNYRYNHELDYKFLWNRNVGYGWLSWQANPTKPNLVPPNKTAVKKEYDVIAFSANYSF